MSKPQMRIIDRHSRPTIGVLAGWQFYKTATNFSYLLPAFRGINRASKDFGCNLLLGCGMGASAKPDDPLRPAWPLPLPDVDFVPIGPWNTDGIVIFNPLHSVVRSEYIQNLIAAGHPIIFIGSGEEGATLAADNQSGISEAIAHLINHNHQRIAFIAGSADDLNGDTGERLNAYQAALKSFGLEFDQQIVAYGRHIYDGGYAAMQRIMRSEAGFTAVLASNDESALGAMKALNENGHAIPDDISVIGFDNRLEGIAHKPSLSTVDVPLFTMGYKAVEYLLHHVENESPLPDIVRFNTRLIVRESCGCRKNKVLSDPSSSSSNVSQSRLMNLDDLLSQWIDTITETVLNQAKNLEKKQCRAYCEDLVNSFSDSLKCNDRLGFLNTLNEIIEQTMTDADDASIWWDAVSFIGNEFKALHKVNLSSIQLIDEILDHARLAISLQIQQRHRRYVSDQRWISSRLSLLTASLLTALNESQIYEILAQHLPEMNIHIAFVVLIEAQGDNPVAWSSLRNALEPTQASIRFSSTSFPPDGLFSSDQPFRLALIPLIAQSGQIGYVVFGVESFDLYGSIVQQLGGALSTAELYRQAVEGRRLAEEANRMKSRFLSTVSHELRTPSNLIVGLSKMILQASYENDNPLPETTQKDIEGIYTYSQHLNAMIGDLLDLATSDAGKLRLNNSFFELGPTLSIVAESGRQLASDKGLSWEAILPESGPWVWGDQTRLLQVILNLINNAIKFTEQGTVSLLLENSSDSVRVMVRDTGLGISHDEQQAIFDEFHQSERSISLGYGGLGLGLAISKRLIEMHGGTIGVHSSGKKDKGSTFYFTLPVVQPPANQAGNMPPLRTKEQTVLVLTNHPESSKRLCEKLNQRGLEVQVMLMNSLSIWQQKLLDITPDAILLDVSSAPEMSWDVLKTIRNSQAAKGIPVMFYKSTQDDGSVLELDYLTKPIEMTELTQALDQQWLLTNIDHPTHTILVVDDEPNTLDMHARIVESHSTSNLVLKAHNGREALDLLERTNIDLVLLDLLMPEMDGFGVLEMMHENEQMSKIPVIILTGKVLTEEDMERLNQGVITILEKGLFSLDETAAHISAALESKRRKSKEVQRHVRKAMAFIHNHFAENITRSDIAQYISISEDYLTFCFRQELGTTPITYLQRYRVNQAKHLLKDTDRAITEIALDVGFSDNSYFSRIFRRITGISPDKFRHKR